MVAGRFTIYTCSIVFLSNHGCVVECLSNITCTSENDGKVLTPAQVAGHLHECEGENLSVIYTSGCVGYLHKCVGENLSVICTSTRVITETRDRIHDSTKTT